MTAYALRPEVEADAAFRLALFGASRGAAWDQAPLPSELRVRLVAQQFSAQTQGYRAAYPDARLEIIEIDSAPAGRLATDRTATALRLIDIALTPERRGQGVGRAILRALMDEAAILSVPVTLQVGRDNLDAQRLYHRLGFVLTSMDETHLALSWSAPSATPA